MKTKTIAVIAMLLLVSSLVSPATALGKGHPDLEVMSFAVTLEPSLENGSTPIILDWTIVNDGKKSSESFKIQLMNGNDIVETISYPQLLPWSSVAGQTTLNLSPGEYTFSLVMDPTNEVREINEDNNKMTVDFIVPLPPPPKLSNLVLSEVELLRSSGILYPLIGDPIGVSFTVTNNGESSVEKVSVEVKLNEGLTIIDMNVGPLSQGESQDIQVMSNYIFEAHGSYKIGVTVDPNNLIEETDEWDNYGKVEVFVYPKALPNVALSNCSVYGGNQASGYALLGDPLCFSCDIENNGEALAFDFDFVVQDETGEIIFSEVMSLKPEEKRIITANTNWRFLTPEEVDVVFAAETWFEEITYGDNIIYTEVCVNQSPPSILISLSA